MTPAFLLIASVLIAASVFIKATLTKYARIPAVVVLIAMGAALRAADERFDIVAASAEEVLSFLADVGVAVLLFHVGLRSDVDGLVKQLPRAALVWICTVAVSGAAGCASAWMLGFGLLPALFVGVAMSATSVGV